MASEELVTEQFQLFGIDVQKEVLSKCVSLCEEFDVDAESFTEQWMAFSLNHLNGAFPNLENIELFVRKEFSKRATNRCNANERRSAAGTNSPAYDASVPLQQSENDILSNYMPDIPKKEIVTSEQIKSSDVLLAPKTPTIESAKYSSRTNPGTVVHSYGDEKLLKIISEVNVANDNMNLNIIQIPNDDGDLYTKAKFGFELLHEAASIFDNHIQYLSQYIAKKARLDNLSSVRHKSQTEVLVSGRIECDANVRLNPKSVVLQGTWAESLSQNVLVDLDNLEQYTLFPGQVVVMRGINPHGDRFIAHQVYCDAALPISDHRAETLPDKLSMVIAAGPYTTSDNMAYNPLKDLIKYINDNRPHVVLLVGPFMDREHSSIKNNKVAETFSSFFDKLLDSLGEVCNTSTFMKIYIVSSVKDCFHVNIYPTPPYHAKKKHANITFVPDPCTLNINGTVVGVTSSDILMQIGQEEISLGMGGDKLKRLASHVVSQQSFWPIWPTTTNVDAALWAAHAQLPSTPNILVLPSNFRYFVKEVNGCVVVNPEHLTKGSSGGTFARLLVTAEGDSKQIAAQIVRI